MVAVEWPPSVGAKQARISSMTEPQAQPSESPRPFSHHWRVITAAGLLGTIYYQICIFGAPRTKFLLALGATPFDFGLLASLGAITMAFQLLSAALANRVKHRKPIWIALFLLHRLVYAGVLITPLLFKAGRARIWWVVGVMFVHNALVHLGDPMWFSWMSDLVPSKTFNRRWGGRQRFITTGSILSGLLIAVSFGWFERADLVVLGFIILGSIAILLGLVDICMFLSVPEPPHHREPAMTIRQALAEPLKDPEFRPFMLFRAYWHFAMMIAAPFFQLYMVRELGYSVATVQLLFVLHGVGLALASGFWGRLCDLFGYRPVLQIMVSIKFIVPLTYLLLPPIPSVALPIFALLFIGDGMVNAAGRLAIQGVALRSTPRRNRAMFIAAANFVALGIAGGVAPLVAGSLIRPLTSVMSTDWGPYRFTGFHVIFLVSAVLRLSAVFFVNRLREPDSQSVGRVLAHIRSERPFWAWPLR